MGISGLLPLLKPIQVRRHLSEYSGQTIAVDAYVWLHRGTYACATDLAIGKNTTKYVDYAMHRVRLLRHHKIVPYIVFDGGPLPAKKGTESERKKRREENLARANSLAAQGKHSQAREYYVKCIDVTPQMAYQLIKALLAESVPYVVAPYEADAQMTYLERIGLVDGILTEDSDLLVFGCKNVLLKLDAVENTVTSISRVDFASLGTSPAGGISLLGWTDVQFRAMAILSGCDYLPSISGIGLKTAWALLKKHKTAENVVRALKMEGKKNVPKGYLEAFKLAEKVFLHQRVYDPTQEILVNLTEVPHGEEWDEEKEAHVGGYIEPSLAKKIAEGDVCPITLLPMEDINPTFVPRALKPIPMNIMSSTKSDTKGKGKSRAQLPEKVNSTSILSFFSSKPKTELPPKSLSQPVLTQSTSKAEKSRMVAGRASGKRTLAELMDQDVAAKRKKREETERPNTPAHRTPTTTSSKFFGSSSSSRSKVHHTAEGDDLDEVIFISGPSRSVISKHEKENLGCKDEDSDDLADFSMDEEPDLVTQEDGYISPIPSDTGWDTPELSSPLRPGTSSSKPSTEADDYDDFGADILSSPPPIRSTRPAVVLKGRNTRGGSVHGIRQSPGRVLVASTPVPSDQDQHVEETSVPGPDLRLFEDWDDGSSEIDECVDDSMESAASSRGPVTPVTSKVHEVEEIADIYDDIIPDDDEELQTQAIIARTQVVADGWWDKWSRNGPKRPNGFPKPAMLRRRETTITPGGRHKPLFSPIAHVQTPTTRTAQHDLRSARRDRTNMVPDRKLGSLLEQSNARLCTSESDSLEIALNPKNRLEDFRCFAA